ncbi:MAG: LytTR family DNA-binding domain-containing protein [Bacteroidota bacterium]
MNSTKISMKWIRLNSSKKKSILWGMVLLLASWNYYRDFFTLIEAFLLAVLLTLLVVGMLGIGYFRLSKSKKFPKLQFWSFTVAFTLSRFCIVYFILQHYLPDWTVFHYPARATLFLFVTSAVLIFLGYSYSIYEWGLAAKMEYASLMKNTETALQHPLQIRSEGKTIRLLPQDILYLEAKGEYINYVTLTKNYMCFQRMKTAESELKTYGFHRTHRSFIINPLHVISFSTSELTMQGHKGLPISKTYRSAVMAALKGKIKKI